VLLASFIFHIIILYMAFRGWEEVVRHNILSRYCLLKVLKKNISRYRFQLGSFSVPFDC